MLTLRLPIRAVKYVWAGVQDVCRSAIYVCTFGNAYSDWGRRHRLLVVIVSLLSIVSIVYLGRDIYDDLRAERRAEIEETPGDKGPVITRPPGEATEAPVKKEADRFCVRFNDQLVCE